MVRPKRFIWDTLSSPRLIRSILNSLAGKFSGHTRHKMVWKVSKKLQVNDWSKSLRPIRTVQIWSEDNVAATPGLYAKKWIVNGWFSLAKWCNSLAVESRVGKSKHCPISTATTHIGSSCACNGGQSHFCLVLVNGLGQSKAVPVSHPKPIMPLFHAVVTVTAKWLYIQPIDS